MTYWKVKLVCGEKKEMTVRDYDRIPASSEERVKVWGEKQAESLGLPKPYFVTATPAAAEVSQSPGCACE